MRWRQFEYEREREAMKKNIWIGVLLVAVVMLAILVGFQGQQIAALKEQMRAMV